jgi:hypothetical protein
VGKVNWRGIISKIAPGLGAALGGPLGGAAGAIIGKVLAPGKEKPTDDDLAQALSNATPDQLLALKQADQRFIAEMKQLDIDVFKLEVSDVQSARELAKVNYWPQIAITTVYIVGYFVVLGLLLSGRLAVQAELREMTTVLIGMLTTAIPMILGFWFGSSFGSREKTAALAASKPADVA